MNNTIENTCLDLIKSGFKVRAWVKPEGTILRVRKGTTEKLILLVGNKIAATY